jgi:hypothetical protein
MAISTIASYLPTMQEFIDHWTDVNTAIAPTVLTLQGGYTVANLTTDRSAVDTAITAVESADNARQIAAGDRDLKKSSARIRLAQFRATVTGLLTGTPYVRTLPKMPRFGDNQGKQLKAFDDVANAWSRINTATIPGFTPPLLLAGGYSLANFTTELAALRAAFVASTNGDADSRQARSERDVLLPPAKSRMTLYRQAVKGILPAGSPLLLTIPAVNPPPGSTPDPVNLSGVWNDTTDEADLSWSASPNPNLDHYSVRTAPGPTYHAADESVVADVLPPDTTFSTNQGLLAPGATALFRVYVVLTTANEKGSNTVSVTHPG